MAFFSILTLVELYLPELIKKYDINTPKRLAHFLAQVHHESAGLSRIQENLNYSVDGLLKTFSRDRISFAQCQELGRAKLQKANQQEIANIVYGGTWGRKNLGNIVYGDGWKYRGRGPIQCTGKANYAGFSGVIGIDLVNDPDKMLDLATGMSFAGFFWKTKNLNTHADKDDIITITRKINGGTLGLKERTELVQEYKKLTKDVKFS